MWGKIIHTILDTLLHFFVVAVSPLFSGVTYLHTTKQTKRIPLEYHPARVVFQALNTNLENPPSHGKVVMLWLERGRVHTIHPLKISGRPCGCFEKLGTPKAVWCNNPATHWFCFSTSKKHWTSWTVIESHWKSRMFMFFKIIKIWIILIVLAAWNQHGMTYLKKPKRVLLDGHIAQGE